MKIFYSELKTIFYEKLDKYGFSSSDSETISNVFTDNTFDGVFTHGINRFPRFIRMIERGFVKVSAKPTLQNAFGAMEQWDGNQGPGILNALHCTKRAMALAAGHGVGIVGLRNTNHWMRAGTYGRLAAERGYTMIAWTNTIPNMPAWGGKEIRLGNNPFLIAIPYKDEPLVLDMAMSQFAYGKLEWMKQKRQQLPFDGGYNTKGELTKDPSEILETERILPAGLWKGSGFSIVLDLAAAIISKGITTQEIGKKGFDTGMSQVYISIETERYLPELERESLIGETLAFIKHNNEGAGYPGERVMKNRAEFRKNGVEIPDELYQKITDL